MLWQIDNEGLVALWRIHATGTEAARWRAMGDLNRNGALENAETLWVASGLLQKAQSGVVVRWNGRVLQPVKAEKPLFEDVPQGGLKAGGLVHYRIPTVSGVWECGVVQARPAVAMRLDVKGLWSALSCFKGTKRCEEPLVHGKAFLGHGERFRVVLKKG